MPKEETRRWLQEREKERWADNNLRPEEIEWIMEVEKDETRLLRWRRDPDCDGPQSPASGGKWFINDGNMMNLPELVWWGYKDLTFFELYRMWLSFPILATRRKHSESQSEAAQLVRNAKTLNAQETGFYGLHSRQREQARGRG